MNQLVLKKKNELMKKKKGFTLVELIIVIAIIAILAAIAIPKFGKIKDTSNKSSDVANAKNISMAVSKAIADDKIDYSTAIDKKALSDASISEVLNNLDGITATTNLKTKGYTTATFVVSVDTSGSVSVYESGGKEIYPTTYADFK